MALFLVQAERKIASVHGIFNANSIVDLDPELEWVKNWVETKTLKPLAPDPVESTSDSSGEKIDEPADSGKFIPPKKKDKG